MAFARPEAILFRHCDPAGIVFYPRYFEMINDTVEAWFADQLATPFATIHKTGAVPTVEITTQFTAPSRLGDVLTFTLTPIKIGRTSLTLNIAARSENEPRLSARTTLVHVDHDTRPTPWPDALRASIQAVIESETKDAE